MMILFVIFAIKSPCGNIKYILGIAKCDIRKIKCDFFFKYICMSLRQW